MTRTVDVVIVGMSTTGRAAAIDAAGRGRRVLVVDKSRNESHWQALRRSMNAAGDGCRRRVSMLTGVEVLWVDGTSGVEVVLLRQIKNGRLIGINTGAVLLTTALSAGVIAPMLRAEVLQGNAK
jgi:choline dehydrogenase-like flavoprotein